METLDSIFIPAEKIIDQMEHEEHFRGKVLSKFAKIEQIMIMMIHYHFLKEKLVDYGLNKDSVNSAHWKINKLNKILADKKYENSHFKYEELMEKLMSLKELRNLFAHNIVYPGSSDDNAKDGEGNITMIVFENNKWKKSDFDKIKQEELSNDLERTFRQLKEIYQFLAVRHGEYHQAAF